MTAVPFVLLSAVKHIYHSMHEAAHDDMSRQASGWIADQDRVARKIENDQPIKLNFAVPKKHRLSWIRRAMQHLPH